MFFTNQEMSPSWRWPTFDRSLSVTLLECWQGSTLIVISSILWLLWLITLKYVICSAAGQNKWSLHYAKTSAWYQIVLRLLYLPTGFGTCTGDGQSATAWQQASSHYHRGHTSASSITRHAAFFSCGFTAGNPKVGRVVIAYHWRMKTPEPEHDQQCNQTVGANVFTLLWLQRADISSIRYVVKIWF